MISPPGKSHLSENQILAGLDKKDYQELFSQLEPLTLYQGTTVYEAQDLINYVYFPETAVFSMLATMEDGRTVEVGPVGNEGLVGLRVFLGAETTPDRVIVHVPGEAMRLRAAALQAELRKNQTALSRKLKRYTGMLLAMTSRSSACNKLHSLEQQLARWLLTMNDYVGDDLRLTHDLIALTLGVRRAGVTEAANNLRTNRLIHYRRNHIQILDREQLQGVTCECYEIIKEEYDALYADLRK